MSIEAAKAVQAAVRRTELLWHSWATASASDRVEIKAQIDAIDADIRSMLEV